MKENNTHVIKSNWGRLESQYIPDSPSIQFIMEYNKDQIPFLDILIKRNENGIWMNLYHKPTDP